ncbi:MAG TPA: PAS domain S-box protein, partial [Gemmatimonadaceae bacterium]|nr:PAS domain S-box protein [Gemmatimonadaceae bacterium]
MSGYTDPALTARLTDPARLRGVDATRLIGARPIESLERLASAATRLLGVPIALVTLVDERRQWFAGLAGLTGWAAEARETPLSHSFCKHVVGDGAPLIVVNATEHVLVRDNRAVFELGVRAYAGVPLTTSDGLALGSFCAIDTKPREWTSDEIEALRDLARVAMAEVEQRIALETLRTREERLTLALEGAGEGVWDWDVATGRVDYSARWCAMLGYLPEEVPRAFEAFERALHPEDRERAVRALTRHLDGGVPRYESEHRLVRKDGTWCWVLDRGQVMARDENGRPQRVLGTITDVSARRTAEDALRTSEAQLSAIIASALDAIITVDEEQRIALFNRAAESTFGLRAENAIGQPLDILIPARFRNAHGQHVREFSATGVASRTMMHPDGLVGLRADGSEFPIEASISQLAAGGRRLFTVILRDISARQQAESERARAEAALRTSEAHYRAVLDALPVGVFVADAGGRLEATNRRAVEIWGGSPETSGIPDYAMYRAWWPDTKVPLRPEDWALARALVRGERCDGERIEIERFDGRRAMILNHAAPMYDGSGRLTGAVVAISDITAQTEADEERGAALRRSEERYAMAARAASAAIWDWDLASGRVDWGEGAREIFGHHEDFAPSFSWWASTVHPDDLERVIASIAAAVAEGSTAREWREEYRLRRGDGTWMEVVDRGYVSRESDGRATRMIGAIEDVTASRRLEARLRQAQKMEAMGQLAGGVAHDFNNLLTVIGAGLEFALDGIPLDAAARSDLEECQRAAERATTLVRQLLTFSRKQPVRPQVLRLGDLVRGAERLLRRVIGEEILLDVHIDAPGAGVYADPGQLEQVLMNLAVNARDAMLT